LGVEVIFVTETIFRPSASASVPYVAVLPSRLRRFTDFQYFEYCGAFSKSLTKENTFSGEAFTLSEIVIDTIMSQHISELLKKKPCLSTSPRGSSDSGASR